MTPIAVHDALRLMKHEMDGAGTTGSALELDGLAATATSDTLPTIHDGRGSLLSRMRRLTAGRAAGSKAGN